MVLELTEECGASFALNVHLAKNPGCSEKIVAAKKRSSAGLHPGGGAGGASAGAPARDVAARGRWAPPRSSGGRSSTGIEKETSSAPAAGGAITEEATARQ